MRGDGQVEDLVAHFTNFNMEDLGATGSPVLHRSMTERVALSPPSDKRPGNGYHHQDGKSLKDELDFKKVKLLELEAENGEMRTLVESLSKEIAELRERAPKSTDPKA